MHQVNYFVQNIPRSHYVHLGFAQSIDAINLKPAPKATPLPLIPAWTFVKGLFVGRRYKGSNLLCEGMAGLYFAATIKKLYAKDATIVYHDADALFYRDYPKMRGLKKKYIDWFLDAVDYAISDSKLSKKHLEKHLKLKKPAKVVYPWMKVEAFTFNTKTGNDVIYVGRLAHEKNLPRFFEAFSRLKEKPTLHIVGDGPLRKELEAMSYGVGIADNVKWYGWREEFTKILSKAKIGYNVSDFEPFGVTALEYAAQGVIPLIGTRNGNKEIFRKAKDITCDPDSIEDIHQKLEALLAKKPTQLLKSLNTDARLMNEKRQLAAFQAAFEELTQ